MANRKVTGCSNSGDRFTDWIHINSAGKVFLCCNDYNFEYEFGDLAKQSVSEIWRGDKHFEIVDRAAKEICTKCLSAVFNEPKQNTSKVVTDLKFSRKQ